MIKQISMDKKYRTNDGRKVRILAIDRVHTKLDPVIALVTFSASDNESIETFDLHGRGCSYNVSLVEVAPYDDFKINDRVIVWNNNNPNKQERGHFAGVNLIGRPMTFYAGQTNWNALDVVYWDNCRRPNEEELVGFFKD